MVSQHYTIKSMTRRELELAIEWATIEGWNPGLYDASCFYNADAQGFFLGLLGDEPIASLSAVKYGPSFGFVGFYIVKPQFRGMGYGLKLWQVGMEYLGDRIIGLDGVVSQQNNYVRSGFHLAHRNIRYESARHHERFQVSPTCIPLSSRSIDEVIAYDRAFFPDDRASFLTGWLHQPESHAVGAIHHDALVGYGMVRRCFSGYKVGPLFANTPHIADEIYCTLRSRIPIDAPVYLDVPEINGDAIALAHQYQMSRVFETARMYTRQPPNLSIDRTFGITSFELG